MTTALIGNRDATTGKAVVAIVAQDVGRELADALTTAGHGHEPRVFPDVAAFDAACAEGENFDLLLQAADADGRVAPTGFSGPTIAVGDGEASLSLTALDQAADVIVALALQLGEQTTQLRRLEQFVEGLHTGSALAGNCPIVRRMQSGISRAADSDVTVLIEGPAGAGKSLAARMIHTKSRNADRPAVIADSADLDASGMSEQLEAARGTTLLLEDVDKLPSPAQSVLVKHLKERSGPRGAGAARIIATTAAHLPEAIARGDFREDLYYRLNAFPLVVPALKERVEDIAAIAESVLQLASAQSGRPQNGLTPAALVLLESMTWPGNVTQLETVVRRAHALAGGAPIDREHVAASRPAPSGSAPTAAPAIAERDLDRDIGEDEIRPFDEEEQYLLSRALRATKGNVRRAAQLLGIGRATLYRKIQQYKLRLQ